MKRSNAVRATFWLATMFAIAFFVRAESGGRQTSGPSHVHARAPGISIVDQNGQPAVSGAPSATSTTVDVTVGPDFAFHPFSVDISVGDTVRWTWAGSGHSVTSGPLCMADSQYCSPNDMSCFPGTLNNTGFVYTHTFAAAGTYQYHCLSHCALGMIGLVNVTGGCAPTGWSAGPNLPTPLVRAVGVYFQPDGNFYTVGGRTSDLVGSDFQHVLRYSPTSNSWTQMGVTLADNFMNNMACGVLSVSGTPSIYCVGGSFATGTTATARVFSYDPVTDTSTVLTSADNWPGNAAGTILPGGFAVANNKLYILGGFNINVAATNQIWEFNPNAAVGARWTQKTNTPVAIMYAPTCSLHFLTDVIEVGGASDYQGGLVVDTTNSFQFDPVNNMTSSITAIPRATGETRALNYRGLMLVMGGGRVAPNPSNEVDIWSESSNTWTTGTPVPAFTAARRNFPTDTDGSNRIWLAGGYDNTGVPTASMEIFCGGGGASPTPTPTPTSTATATATATPTATGASPTVTPTSTATATATATATPTATGMSPTVTPPPTATPTATPGGRTTPTPRPRPTPAPRR